MSYWEHGKPVQRERAVAVSSAARAAAELLNAGGLRALTLRAVANRLGVAPASLYSRIDSVEDLFDIALDAALGDDSELARAVAEAGLEDLMLSFYRHLVRHRWACQVIAMRPPRGPHYLRLSERMCELLIDRGATEPLRAAYALSNFVIGSAATAHIAGSEREAAVDPVIAPTYARLHGQQRDEEADVTLIAAVKVLSAHFNSQG